MPHGKRDLRGEQFANAPNQAAIGIPFNGSGRIHAQKWPHPFSSQCRTETSRRPLGLLQLSTNRAPRYPMDLIIEDNVPMTKAPRRLSKDEYYSPKKYSKTIAIYLYTTDNIPQLWVRFCVEVQHLVWSLCLSICLSRMPDCYVRARLTLCKRRHRSALPCALILFFLKFSRSNI